MTLPIAAINHISISVRNIEESVQFYQNVMGWQLIGTAPEVVNDGSVNVAFCESLFGRENHTWTSLRIGHMVSSNGVGIELVEFGGNYPAEDAFEFKKNGLFHFAITVPNVKEFVENFTKHGGEVYSDFLEYPVSEVNFVNTIYCKDPFGVVFEVHNHDYVYLNKSC